LSPASISFVSFYVHSPRASGPVCAIARILCNRVKNMDAACIAMCVGVVARASVGRAQFSGLFGGATLVPVPGSAQTTNEPWPAYKLALALREVGLGTQVWAGLRRALPVRKSATSMSGKRPTVRQHFESLYVGGAPPEGQKLILVDDVITKGRTMLAAAACLQSKFPHADIRAFALFRTHGVGRPLERVVDVCQGVVRWAGGDARRDP
jgi:hypothetical protein